MPPTVFGAWTTTGATSVCGTLSNGVAARSTCSPQSYEVGICIPSPQTGNTEAQGDEWPHPARKQVDHEWAEEA